MALVQQPFTPFPLRAVVVRCEPVCRLLGTALLNIVIRRATQAVAIAGVTALRVHALFEQARRFVVSRGFIGSPGQSMTLRLVRASVEQALREA
jgi:hypothetical protein